MKTNLRFQPKTSRTSIIVVVLMLFAQATFSQNIAGKADELLTAYTNQKKFSGNVLIAKGGQVVFQKAYGFADVSNNIPNTLETEFQIASVSKTFTSALILKLAEKGYLSINDPLKKFIPDYPQGNKILVRHLMSHTSGIKNYTSEAEYFDATLKSAMTTEQIIKLFKHDPLEFEPGTAFDYSNSNYIILSHIAEHVTGSSLTSLYKKEIFNKLKMKQSGLVNEKRISQNKSKSYKTDPQSGEWKEASSINIANAVGAGGLYSTIGDLYKWERSFYSNDILSPAAINMATTAYEGDYGYGWTVREKHGRTEVSHGGKTPDGYVASLIRYPEEGLCIILLSNYDDTNGRQISDELTAIAFNEPVKLPVQKKEITLSGEVLSKFAGVYELNDKFKILISVEGDKLYGLTSGDSQKIELKAESPTKFFLKGPEVELEFIEENGKIVYMLIKQQGGMKLKKIS